MKKSILYTFALSCLFAFALSSCRPARELNHSVDFSSAIENLHKQNEWLAEQVRQSENRQVSSLENWQRQHAESEHRRENENVVIREFDTTQPDNPILRETRIERIIESETQITSVEMREIIREEIESIFTEKFAEFERNTLNIVAENNQLREEIKEKETKAQTRLWIGLVVGFFAAIVFLIALVWFLKKNLQSQSKWQSITKK